MKLSELKEGSEIVLRISANSKMMKLNAVLKQHLYENAAIIAIMYDTDKKLNFNNVTTDVIYYPDDDVPKIWYQVEIMYCDGDYILKVVSDGVNFNRRNYFRVGISQPANLITKIPGGPSQVTIKDVSLTGFAIADRKKELKLSIGDSISVAWEDIGHNLKLTGCLKRIEEHPDVTVYGFEICNVCNDLSSYINTKQKRRK